MENIMNSPLKKISLLSKILVSFCKGIRFVYIIISSVFLIYLLLSPTRDMGANTILQEWERTGLDAIMFNFSNIEDVQFSLFEKIKGSLFIIFVSFFIMKGLKHLQKLLEYFQNKEIFCEGSIQQAKAIANLYLVWLVLSFLILIVRQVLGDVPKITISSMSFFPDFLLLGFIYLVSWTMEMGKAIYVDQELTI